MSLELLYQQKKIKNYQKILSKGFGRLVHWNECKTKIENKMRQISVDIFSNQDF